MDSSAGHTMNLARDATRSFQTLFGAGKGAIEQINLNKVANSIQAIPSVVHAQNLITKSVSVAADFSKEHINVGSTVKALNTGFKSASNGTKGAIEIIQSKVPTLTTQQKAGVGAIVGGAAVLSVPVSIWGFGIYAVGPAAKTAAAAYQSANGATAAFSLAQHLAMTGKLVPMAVAGGSAVAGGISALVADAGNLHTFRAKL